MKVLEKFISWNWRARTCLDLCAHKYWCNLGFTKRKILADPDAKTKHDVIKIFNDFFDVMNSRRRHDQCKLRSGFEIHLEDQMQILDEMEEFLNSFKVIKKTEG